VNNRKNKGMKMKLSALLKKITPLPWVHLWNKAQGENGKMDRMYSRHAANVLPELVEALSLILPMAKGYAHKNAVGNNWKFVEQAEQILARAEEVNL
jgi:hypothetical protein